MSRPYQVSIIWLIFEPIADVAYAALALLSSPQVVSNKTRRIVEYSSGSTVISMSIIARILHGITDTRAYLSNKTSGAKLRLMQFFGLDVYVALPKSAYCLPF